MCHMLITNVCLSLIGRRSLQKKKVQEGPDREAAHGGGGVGPRSPPFMPLAPKPSGWGPEGFGWRWYAHVFEAACLGKEPEIMSPAYLHLTTRHPKKGQTYSATEDKWQNSNNEEGCFPYTGIQATGF